MLGVCLDISDTQSPTHNVAILQVQLSAAATFVISIALMWMGYSVSVFSGNRHVLRRSALGGIFWSMCIPFSSFALISVGVGLRMLMKTGSAAASSKETFLLSGAIVAFFLFSVIVDYLHNPQAYRGRLLMQLVRELQYSLHMFASTARALWLGYGHRNIIGRSVMDSHLHLCQSESRIQPRGDVEAFPRPR